MKIYQPKHTIKALYKDTYTINDYGIGQGKVQMYLLVGTEKALLIDSGYGLLDLKAIIRTVTDKPVICVCTHGHLDHAPGACQFEEAYLHSRDFDVYKKHTSPELINTLAMDGLLIKPPKRMRNNPSYQGLAAQMAQKKYPPLRTLDEVEAFDLGGRLITWRPIPGHTQGSIAIIDEASKTAFDGDAAAPGAWLFLEESGSLPDYLAALDEYRSFLLERGILRRYVGHSGSALRDKSLQKLMQCVQVAIAKPNKGFKVKSPLGNARIVFAGGSLLFCGR